MDLHDYADVAENYDLYLEVMYSVRDNYENFKDFYLDLARQYGVDGCIDIACGTGAVLLYLAKNGINIDGSDISDEMVRVAIRKSKEINLDLNIWPSDMVNMKSSRKYSLAIIARSGFMHVLTPELQRKALLSIREMLVPGGVLTLNTFAPHPIFQEQQMKNSELAYEYRLEYKNAKGKREKIYNAITYDPFLQHMYGNWKFETLDDNGTVVEERIRPLRMRQTYKQEMLYLAELCGFEVVEIYSDYYKNKEQNGMYIWVLKKT